MSTTLQLPVEGILPPLDGATAWLNSPPLTESALLGRPVLVEFWTFTCINWIRTLPYVRAWFEKYRAEGLTVIGVHTPEFAVERDIDGIRRAAKAMRVEFPIAVDSDYSIWRAFGNQYWPALYFIDKDGQIRHHRFGEGEYEYSEIIIQRLLAAAGAAGNSRELVSVDPQGAEAPADWDNLRSPETYIGYGRAESFVSPTGAAADQRCVYEGAMDLSLNQWTLSGDWTVGRQSAVLNEAGGRIVHRFHARDLHLVMGPPPRGEAGNFRIRLDGEPPGTSHGVDADEHGNGVVTETRLYQLVRQPQEVADRTFEIEFLDPGARAYVFTFG
jgi:thiol-disulfide isomerase/thioredoxin